MHIIITVFLSLAVVVLNACADEKVANKQNFATAVNQYFKAHPTCIEFTASEHYKFPATILPTHNQYYQNEPVILTFLGKLGLLTAQETTVDVPETPSLPIISVEKKPSPKMVKAQQIVYALSDLGKAAYRENVSHNFFDGTHHGFCYGEPRVVEIINYSEPADLLGQKVSEVHFTYAVYNLASWAASDTVRYAAEQALNSGIAPGMLTKSMNERTLEQITNAVTQNVQSVKAPLKGKAALILTSNGWMHEKMFRN